MNPFTFYTESRHISIKQRHEIPNNVVCATSKGSDQPAQMHSLIRAFASRLNSLWVVSYYNVVVDSDLQKKWVWSGNTTITNCRQPRGTVRKSRSTITRHQENKLSKAISSLFPIKMIAILEWTLSNVQQNIEQLQTPTMGVTINKKSTTTEQVRFVFSMFL